MGLDTVQRCDNCENTRVLNHDESDLSEGWLVIVQDLGDDDELETYLCSRRCLAVWAVVNASDEIGLTA